MFKVLSLGALLFSSFALRFEGRHDEIQWRSSQNFSDSDKSFDDFFRDKIKALGDSVAKKVAHVNGQTRIQYLDTTNDNDQTVAWEVDGTGDNQKRVEKVVQVKTTPDPDDSNISTITKTTFLRDNLINVAKNEFA